MRKYKRYKLFAKLSLNFYFLRILKFKRTKWKVAQKLIKNLKLNKYLLNFRKKLVLFNIWGRIKLEYKNKLKNQHYLKCRYDIAKILFTNSLVQNIKQEYTLSTCLWHLNIFKTLYEAHNYINRGLVLVNNNICFNLNKKLFCGDIISFNKELEINILNSRVSNEIYLTFFEIDYYLKIVIVIKDSGKISFQDLTLLLH